MLGLCAILGTGMVGAAEGPPPRPRTALKVCADPYSLPSSNKEEKGFENRIARIFAADLKLPLRYTWFPQRMGFIRNTLKSTDTPDKSYKCDLVMGVVENFELAARTPPYYRSSWAMVYRQGSGLDDVHSLADLAALSPERRAKLRIGAFDQSPIMIWLHDHGFMEQVLPYPMLSGDIRAYPGEIVDKELVSGRIDLTFVWGPIGGYFAKEIAAAKGAAPTVGAAKGVAPKVVVIPLASEPGLKLEYGISMAVRHGEKEWKETVTGLIERHQAEIHKILAEYGVPLIEAPAKVAEGNGGLQKR
jgi:quinoprotein dehydrogenase-associated probable ABC transporter substrate-binding protein